MRIFNLTLFTMLGMKKEWILSDEEKQQKRAKIEENRAKKKTPSSSNPASNNPSTSAVNSPQDSVGGDEGEGAALPLSPSSSDPLATTEHSPEVEEATVTADCAAAAPAALLLESRPQARVLPSARASTGSQNGSSPMRPSKVRVLFTFKLCNFFV